MDRLLILMGLKKPPAPSEFPPLPANDDSPNSKGLTQFFNINLDGILDSDSGTSGTRSVADSIDQDPYRDVNLRVHVRLLKKQSTMKVRLHVKVDPEETDNWIIPAKGKTNDLFFYGDEQLIPPRKTPTIKRVESEFLGEIDDDSISAGYHSQTSHSRSSIAEMSQIQELESIPVIQEDFKFRYLMSELEREKQDYDTTKLELCLFVYSKVLKNAVSAEEVKAYPFDKICRILRDYFRSMGIKIAHSGDLVFFEKRRRKWKMKRKKGMGSIDILSQTNLANIQDAQHEAEFSTKKKHCKQAIELYTELEERFINYRQVYYDAVDSYDVQVIESRYGYFMCEMQEELMMGNMILSGQVVPD